ncbi:MAG: heme lyase CcmF/NrfE family subunit [Acidobacteriota bacterium]
MGTIGTYALFIALALALWGAVAAFVAYRTNDLRYLRSAVRSIHGITALSLLAVAALWIALLKNDFTIKYVWEYSRSSQPIIYKLSALWGGMNGSILFWCALLAVFCSLAVVLNRTNNLRLLPFTSFVLLLTLLFFLVLLNFKTSPFEPLMDSEGLAVKAYAPEMLARIEGNGLNPLLQNVYMAIHPPMLYQGYVGFAIPFAFILGALAHRERNTFWMRSARNWAMYSWLTLGIGILLGGYWAYIELGWGGYWAWDPVENASFLPWVTGTAFLHSFLMQEKRGIYRFWNVFFIMATFLLCIYGTFLTRSGILQSVHAFGQEDPTIPWYFKIGNIFIAFMLGMLALGVVLILRRQGLLKSGQRLESAGSRESLFLYGNLLLGLMTLIVLFGVTSPIFVRMVTGKEVSHGPEFYNPRILPVALAILLVMGIASIAPWRRGGWAGYRRHLLFPSLAGGSALAVSIAAFLYGGAASRADFASRPLTYAYLFACIALSFFVAAILVEEYIRSVKTSVAHGRATMPRALLSPFRDNPRRYGGYLVHLGMVCLFLGVAFSGTFQKEYQETMRPGDAVRFGPYTVRMAGLNHDDLNADLTKVNEARVWADLHVFKGDRFVAHLRPQRVFYAANPQQPTYEVAIHSRLMNDFYTLLAGFDPKDGTAVIGAFVNPMVAWLWLGGLLVLIGGTTALVPMRRY